MFINMAMARYLPFVSMNGATSPFLPLSTGQAATHLVVERRVASCRSNEKTRRRFVKKFVALTAVATAALAATPALAQAPQGPRVEAIVGYDAPRIKVNDSGINGT